MTYIYVTCNSPLGGDVNVCHVFFISNNNDVNIRLQFLSTQISLIYFIKL